MSDSVRVWMTAQDTKQRLTAGRPLPLRPAGASNDKDNVVRVCPRVQYQEILGFGGAFTEAASATLDKLSPARQQEVLDAYFGPAGHRYSLCRTHINSCDFSLENWACCEKKGDFALETFSLDRERRSLLPMIQRALAVSGGPFRLFASPWSPPAWMKTTRRMNRGGKLREDCRDAWALYYCRFIHAMAAEGVEVWGLTIQNEPAANQPWDSCLYSAEEERDFLRDHLGPALQREGLGHVKVMVWDHNRDLLFERAAVVYDDPAASQYAWGAGFHWYMTDNFENVRLLHEAYPDKHLVFTEGCNGIGMLGSWETGERYARSIIHDLNNWAEGWTDWNLLLDETGGPNHVRNFCNAPIIADTAKDKLLYQSSYYYMGHFARFIRPGDRRILATTTLDELEATAAAASDGTVTVVVLNRSDKKLSYLLKCAGRAARASSPAHSIVTYQL